VAARRAADDGRDRVGAGSAEEDLEYLPRAAWELNLLLVGPDSGGGLVLYADTGQAMPPGQALVQTLGGSYATSKQGGCLGDKRCAELSRSGNYTQVGTSSPASQQSSSVHPTIAQSRMLEWCACSNGLELCWLLLPDRQLSRISSVSASPISTGHHIENYAAWIRINAVTATLPTRNGLGLSARYQAVATRPHPV
jgi:hypothetical protein